MADKSPQRKERRRYVRKEGADTEDIVIQEKRRFIRCGCNEPFTYTVCTHFPRKGDAATVDVSQSGILFLAEKAPPIESIISIVIEQEMLEKCLSLEKLLHEENGEIIAKVVRVVSDEDTGHYRIAAAFLKKGM